MSLSFTLPLRPNVPERKSSKPLIGKSKALGACHLKQNTVSQLIKNDLYKHKEDYFDINYQNAIISESFSLHLSKVLEILKKHLPKNSKLVEVGCGKGHFLEMIEKDQWFTVKGYDKTYEGRNPLIKKRYLSPNEKVRADIVVLRHVLDEVESPHKFLEMLSNIFGNALIFIEILNFNFILKNQMFHEVTYERVHYFTPNSLEQLFENYKDKGLLFNKHYQFILAPLKKLKTSYAEIYDNSDNWVDLKFTDLFQKLAHIFKTIDSNSLGKKIFIWGGSTKGVLFCYHMKTYCQPLLDRVIACIDSNPDKQGKLLPCTHIPIISPEEFILMDKGPARIIVMNNNYYNEIKSYLKKRSRHHIDVVSLFNC